MIMNRSRSSQDESDYRPASEQLVDLHVYVVPTELWREHLRSAANKVIHDTISVGFIRVYPDSILQSLREEIEAQIGGDLLPKEFVFLKCVGRCFTRIRPKQEHSLTAKNFLPPRAYAPELFLLDADAANQMASISNSPAFYADSMSITSVTSYDYHSSPRRHPPPPTIPPIRSDDVISTRPSDRTIATQTAEDLLYSSKSSSLTVPGGGGRGKEGGRTNGNQPRILLPTDPALIPTDGAGASPRRPNGFGPTTQGRSQGQAIPAAWGSSKGRGNGAASTKQTQTSIDDFDSKPLFIEYDDDVSDSLRLRNDESSVPAKGWTVPTRAAYHRRTARSGAIVEEEEEGKQGMSNKRDPYDSDTPLSATPNGSPRPGFDDDDIVNTLNDKEQERLKELLRKQVEEEERIMEEKERELERRAELQRAAAEERKKQEEEKEQERRRQELEQRDIEEQKRRQQAEERKREELRQLAEEEEELLRQAREEEMQRKAAKDTEAQLRAKLAALKSERERKETERDSLLHKTSRQLGQSTRANQKRNVDRDSWKKLYYEEKKKTPPLDEQCTKLKQMVDMIHRKVLAQVSGAGAIKDMNGRPIKLEPSEKDELNENNIKIQGLRLRRDIDDLHDRLETTKMKLTAEMKLRTQAESEMRELRSELSQRKLPTNAANLPFLRDQFLNRDPKTNSHAQQSDSLQKLRDSL